MLFKATLETVGEGPDAQSRLDRFRESERPGTEHGVTLSGLAPAGEPGTFTVDVDIDTDDAAEAEETFDRMRAATAPHEHGLSLHGLVPADPAPGMSR